MPSPRNRAFMLTSPTGWRPVVGDRVFLPRRKPFGKSARGTIEASLLPDLLAVCYRVHGTIKRAQIMLGDLRPVPKPRPRRKKG
jgi:hypothetical protein